jgi:hypothetical protein
LSSQQLQQQLPQAPTTKHRLSRSSSSTNGPTKKRGNTSLLLLLLLLLRLTLLVLHSLTLSNRCLAGLLKGCCS